MKNPGPALFLTFTLAATATGCVFSKLDDDLSRLEEASHVFTGIVSADRLDADAIVVLVLRDSQGGDIAGFRVMSGPGPFEINSNPVPTYLFGFDDLNKDLAFQANEPYGWAAAGEPLDPKTDATDNINIAIATAGDDQSPIPQQLIDEPLGNHISDNVRFNLGTVSSLDNPWFSQEQAEKGLWQPFAFMEDGGSSIHFLQAYDPAKIPVLFVHGINGTPQNFTALINTLDPSKYQAWVYSYPSGLRLSQLAGGMYQFLEMLHRREHFAKLNLCVQNNTCKYQSSYTPLSTPWNGVPSAKSGIEWAPTVVPVWRDIDPDSKYVTTLFDTPLPDGLPYHLFFGFRQNSIFGSESGDGVIKLTSQLRDVAQVQAQMMRGFDEDHVTILSNETVIGTVYEILETNSQ